MAKRKLEELSESELLYELLWKKYNALDSKKVIYAGNKDGMWSVKLGGKPVKGTELQNLQNEAKMIKQTRLWAMMLEAKKNAAHTYMFTGMKTLDDAHYGKTLLYSMSIDEQILDALENIREVAPPKQYAETRYQPQV